MGFLVVAVAGVAQAGPVVFGPVSDPQGDFPSTYDGPKNSDIDVKFAQVTYNPAAQTLTFLSQMWAPIGSQSPAGIYVWGIDHGHGTEQFQTGDPALRTGVGVFFDQVIVIRQPSTPTVIAGQTFTSVLSTRDLTNDTISLTIPISLVPATLVTDKPITQWAYNLWPRSGAGGNNVISDFAPSAADLLANGVPEPASVIAMGSGILMVLAISLRNRPRRGTA